MASDGSGGGFRTGHVGLNVTDIERSGQFYRTVFGFDAAGGAERGDRSYLFLVQGGDLVLTLWQQSRGDFASDRPGLHHLSFEVGSIDEVRSIEERVRAAGARIHHDGVVAHAEGAQSGGLYFDDPDGIRLEVFASQGAGEAPAPHGAEPTCGFF